jgi:hypothetical protein
MLMLFSRRSAAQFNEHHSIALEAPSALHSSVAAGISISHKLLPNSPSVRARSSQVMPRYPDFAGHEVEGMVRTTAMVKPRGGVKAVPAKEGAFPDTVARSL